MKKQEEKDVIKALVIMLLIVTAAFIVVLLCGWTSQEVKYQEFTYTVQCGDTLDGLYYEYGGGNLEKWRYDMKERNGMTQSGLFAGEEIVVLTYAE